MKWVTKTIIVFVFLIIAAGAFYLFRHTTPKPGSDSQHLEGTTVTLPEHPQVQVTIHYTNASGAGQAWAGYSKELVKGTWFGKPINTPRWAVSVNPLTTLDLPSTRSLIVFSVTDNLDVYVNKLPGNTNAPVLLSLNGYPDGELSYVGLFQNNNDGARTYLGALLIGNGVYVSKLESAGDNLYRATYNGTLSEDAAQFVDLSLFKHPPVDAQEEHTLLFRVEGETLKVVPQV